jgi:hypothetical protein
MLRIAVLVIICSLQSAMAQQAPTRDAQTERLFGEYYRLKAMQSDLLLEATQTRRAERPKGDFWIPGEFERKREGRP